MGTQKKQYDPIHRWEDDGPKVSGIIVGLRWMQSKFSDEHEPVITLGKDDGSRVQVWLGGRLRKEVEAQAPKYGDKIEIERGPLTDFTAKDGSQRQFRAWDINLIRPSASPVDLDSGPGFPEAREAAPAQAGQAAIADEDIPFAASVA